MSERQNVDNFDDSCKILCTVKASRFDLILAQKGVPGDGVLFWQLRLHYYYRRHECVGTFLKKARRLARRGSAISGTGFPRGKPVFFYRLFSGLPDGKYRFKGCFLWNS
ncbi:MAG: hypothetical protein J6E31_03570 [Pyramidobacter sp.]|nr:hypothetical protein [Pyramidobacter sp.]